MNSNVFGLVLAAGKSTRMGFNKLVQPLGGHPLVWYSIQHLSDAGIDQRLVVVGHEKERITPILDTDVKVIVQTEQLGTGNAAACAIPYVKDADYVIVLFGDCPFIVGATIKHALEYHIESNAGITVGTSRMTDARDYGRIERGRDGRVTRVLDTEESRVVVTEAAEIFAGLSIWNGAVFRETVADLPRKPRLVGQPEQELPDAVEAYTRAGGTVAAFDEISEDDALGPNQPGQFKAAAAYLSVKVKERIIAKGGRITDFDSVNIGYDVQVGSGSEIGHNTTLSGKTVVGENCRIGPSSHLENCLVGDECTIGPGHWVGQSFPRASMVRNTSTGTHKIFRCSSDRIPENPRSAFVAMPLKEPFSSRLENVIRPTLETLDFDCTVATDMHKVGIVMEDVWVSINQSALVLAEITEPNPNVWYEVGIAHALNKDVIFLKDSSTDSDIPFDVQNQRILLYDSQKADLRPTLERWLKNVKRNAISELIEYRR